jgi:hypothetical protein
MERVLAEISDAGTFELRTMALEALGRREEARKTLELRPGAALAPVFVAVLRALTALLDGRAEAAPAFADLAARHSDPEALFMYGTCQARVGDHGPALATLVASVDGGFASPQALRVHPWLAPLHGDPAFTGLLERAEAAHRQAAEAFHEAGGPALLGV